MSYPLSCLSLLFVASLFSSSFAAEPHFTPLFDGKTLNGWRGDATYWKVVDGVIVGDTSPTGGMKKNTFLIADGDYADFALRVKFKLVGGASGVQFRSRPLNDSKEDEFRVTGYQADIDNGGSTGSSTKRKVAAFWCEPTRRFSRNTFARGSGTASRFK